MIKFFRRIRRNLIGEGNLKRYLLYAIGEILLVMIGILLALQVNNWNQNRNNKERELILVKSLDKEFAINAEYIHGRIDYLTLHVEKKGKRLIKLTGPSPDNIEIDSLSLLLLNAIYQAPYAPIIAKYQDIMSSDDNNLISNNTLKQLLFEYQAKLDMAIWNQFEMREDIIRYLHTNYSTLNMLTKQKMRIFNELKNEDYTTNYFPIDPMVILSDKKFQNMIVTRFEANAFTMSLLKDVLWHLKKMNLFIQRHYEL